MEEGVGRVVVPKKGKLFDDDGQVQVAVIRPCVSRGKRLKGLPPIYEARMLSENAQVFSGWHMWMGHMSTAMREALEELEEQLQEAAGRGRPFSELGGRLTKTWFDPDFSTPLDEEFGYRRGATMGKAIPYPGAKAILEADPEAFQVSIAAWPTAARPASPSWDGTVKGMAVEGFRSKPRGSVDWVLRAGAGGGPVPKVEELAVSSLRTYYASERDMPNWKNMTAAEIRKGLLDDAPEIAEELGIEEEARPARTTTPAASGDSFTRQDVERLLETQKDELTTTFESRLKERESLVEDEVDELLEARESARAFEKIAHKVIKASGLSEGWQEDLSRRYSVLPSGPSQALLVEEDGDKSAEDVLKENLEADIAHARELIEQSGGVPVVEGLGNGGQSKRREGGSGGKKRKKNTDFRTFLAESRGKAPKDSEVKQMVREGVSTNGDAAVLMEDEDEDKPKKDDD